MNDEERAQARGRGLFHYFAAYWAQPTLGWPIYPFCVEEAAREGRVEYHERSCAYLCVVMMLEGSLFYSCDGSPEIEVAAASALLLPEGSKFSFRSASPPRYRKLVLEIKGGLLKEVVESLGLDRFSVLSLENWSSAVERTRELARLVELGRSEDVPRALGLTHELLCELSSAARRLSGGGLLMERAKARLDRLGENSMDIPAIAAELGICHSLFGRLFKRTFGVSPRDYRTSRRVEAAKELLLGSSAPLKEIALRLGYANQLYFSTDFRKRCGVSPGEFRRREGGLLKPGR